mmetsp:Transcript_41035/g.105915  ORF Transcript_41035/g.105915 Transcript_41035/m.105915 type:complete len:218 (+) Transcript_41035:632-1285(+)
MLTVARLAASHVHLQQQLVHLGHGTGLHGLRQGCPLRALDVHLQDRQRLVAMFLHDVRQWHDVDALLVVPEHALAIIIRSLCREPDLHEVQGRRPRWVLAIRDLRLHQLPELLRRRGGVEDPNLAVRGEAQHGDLEGRVPTHAEGVNDAALLSAQLLRIALSVAAGHCLLPLLLRTSRETGCCRKFMLSVLIAPCAGNSCTSKKTDKPVANKAMAAK